MGEDTFEQGGLPVKLQLVDQSPISHPSPNPSLRAGGYVVTVKLQLADQSPVHRILSNLSSHFSSYLDSDPKSIQIHLEDSITYFTLFSSKAYLTIDDL